MGAAKNGTRNLESISGSKMKTGYIRLLKMRIRTGKEKGDKKKMTVGEKIIEIDDLIDEKLLKAEEQDFIENYRKLDDKCKEIFRYIAKAMIEALTE